MKKMLSVERFKEFVEEVSRFLGLFEMHDCYSLDLLKEYYSKGYDPNNLYYYYKRILKYDPSQEIEDDIIGDGKYDEYAGRLKTVRYKLGVGTEWPYIGIEANVDLFYKEKNPELYQALIAINDGDKETAFWTMERLRQIATVSNIIIGQVKKMLDDIDNRLINGNNTAEATTPETPPETSPDFSHTNSFTPTIEFDMSALYSFLIKEGVIRNVDEALFRDCISHAHVNELWGNGVISKLKLVIHHLQQNHYPQEWFDEICNNLGMTRKDMGKFNVPKRKEFEQKMTMLK